MFVEALFSSSMRVGHRDSRGQGGSLIPPYDWGKTGVFRKLTISGVVVSAKAENNNGE
nr:hypothetical protein [Candidatus Njordarchaeota archaeon]